MEVKPVDWAHLSVLISLIFGLIACAILATPRRNAPR